MANDNDESRTNEGFDRLLAEMPRIAEAVKAFPEAVQPQAFERLMAELTGGTSSARPSRESRAPQRRRSSQQAVVDDHAKRPRRRATNPTTVRELDLAPQGKTSFKDFVAEKRPKTNHDRNAVSVYYLAETLELDEVNVDHVFTCYRDMSWREPGDLANSLALTSSRKRFINTANLDDIKITPAGRNHVKHDLPPKKKKDS